MHLYPQRWNVAAQVVEELKTVTYTTPPTEEHRKKEKEKSRTNRSLCFLLLLLLILNGVQGGVIGVQPLRLSVGLQLPTFRQVFLQAALLLLLGFSQHSIQIWTQQTHLSTRIGTLKLHILPTQHPDLDTANKPVN